MFLCFLCFLLQLSCSSGLAVNSYKRLNLLRTPKCYGRDVGYKSREGNTYFIPSREGVFPRVRNRSHAIVPCVIRQEACIATETDARGVIEGDFFQSVVRFSEMQLMLECEVGKRELEAQENKHFKELHLMVTAYEESLVQVSVKGTAIPCFQA